jgi:hypothetical protein
MPFQFHITKENGISANEADLVKLNYICLVTFILIDNFVGMTVENNI